jgi:predicted TIM-barrel fold metal-dependent hydrolase
MCENGKSSFLADIVDSSWEVIDSHVHLYSYNYLRLITQLSANFDEDIDHFIRRQTRRLKIDLPPLDPAGLGERWASQLDRYGISRACLLAGVPGDEYSINKAVRARPHRFIAFISVNPFLDVAEEVIEHAWRVSGVRGIYLHPCQHRFHAADERVYPIYRLAKQLQLVVYVDYGPCRGDLAAVWGAADNHDPRFNNPAQLHFAASDFPTVKFVITHICEKNILEVLRLGLLCPNVYLSAFPVDDVYDCTYSPADFEYLLEMSMRAYGHTRILFGTGSGVLPRGWRSDKFRAFLAALRKLGVAHEEIGMILGGNIKRLFRLDDHNHSYLLTL